MCIFLGNVDFFLHVRIGIIMKYSKSNDRSI